MPFKSLECRGHAAALVTFESTQFRQLLGCPYRTVSDSVRMTLAAERVCCTGMLSRAVNPGAHSNVCKDMQRTDIRRVELPELVVRECLYAPGLRLPRHTHDYSNVTIVINGQIEEWAEGGQYRGRSCSVVLKPAGVEHENRVSGVGVRTLTIEPARHSSIERQIRQRQWSWFEEPEIVRAAVALRRSMRDSSAADVETHSWDLLAAVLSTPTPGLGSPAWLSDVKRMLEERFDEHVRFEEIAEDVGLHPVYLSRAFHRHAGVSMSAYVRALQLRQARHLLCASKRTVAAIASESGFTDSSHLCHTFSSLLGVTPKTYRRLCQ